MVITLEQLRAIMPHAGSRAAVYVLALSDAMVEFGIDTPARRASFLAQLSHESGQLRYVRELASGDAYEGREDLGNTKPEALAIAAEMGSTPGRFWKGRGLIQVTGFDNYKACGEALALPLLRQPALLEQVGPACRSAGWFWQSRQLNPLADRGDFKLITRRINGGVNGFADRLAAYERAQQVLA
jgi:putative chitinase